ncbi:arylamine N-acetyltransferase family protein [Dictyostelium discoideum AX4]|uniref:Probable arylamine N-acetyltransferase 3 n=2 Tax=Dictyostelium discoideum TaxID=44689 RepID=ARY3_DICDI|nr:arylamine N-acetyltransferase family protein [Dictyostelium discoideum AX4]Q54IU7.1 RecName: Full=Probable arylamine N-acetyltransferase 3; AltName: Full=Arylamide acetylase 3; AltName: Full=N-acetyltransferase type 3; Short=NAT-3 [Dictyostelium discoideum]EAL63188.1 arylamine N-acetyltransferase family protein [Dictyostelium discoideum AX4]CBL43356.1 TPA: arylamine N-acetyltransferase 1 [Dictyostelium discoideum]|eukprot:XP_636691.1 arylamine N-acetyltransferase family protein [Dictyostelium discoideum AX4]
MEAISIFSDYQLQFFKRIGMKPKPIETLDDVSDVMKACSNVFSFENLDIVSNSCEPLNKDVLIKQVICNNQGGLCYKINTLLYHFLLEFGFKIHIIRGSVENQETHSDWNIPTGHMINIINFENRLYVVDVAFGCNLSLRPIPITDDGSEVVESCTGLYRVRKVENCVSGKYNYTHILEHRKLDSFLIESGKTWVTGYAFDPLLIVDNNNNNEKTTHQTLVQQLVIDDPTKEFSTKPLATKIVNDGSSFSIATLTANSFTLTDCKTGQKTKTNFDNDKSSFEQFNQHLISIFNLPPLKTIPPIFLN